MFKINFEKKNRFQILQLSKLKIVNFHLIRKMVNRAKGEVTSLRQSMFINNKQERKKKHKMH